MDCSASRTRATPSRESTPTQHRMIRRAEYPRFARLGLFQRKLRGGVAGKRHRFLEIAKREFSELVFSASRSGHRSQLIFPGNYILTASFCAARVPTNGSPTAPQLPMLVIPAKAGIQYAKTSECWIPAFAGMGGGLCDERVYAAYVLARRPNGALHISASLVIGRRNWRRRARLAMSVRVARLPSNTRQAQRAPGEVHFAPSLAPSFVVGAKTISKGCPSKPVGIDERPFEIFIFIAGVRAADRLDDR
jgi:hypothetical protein